jgi:hypothetical protein
MHGFLAKLRFPKPFCLATPVIYKWAGKFKFCDGIYIQSVCFASWRSVLSLLLPYSQSIDCSIHKIKQANDNSPLVPPLKINSNLHSCNSPPNDGAKKTFPSPHPREKHFVDTPLASGRFRKEAFSSY